MALFDSSRWICFFGLSVSLLGCREAPLPAPSAISEENTLQYRWNTDHILHYRFDLSQDIEVNSETESIQNFTRLEQSYRLKPKSAGDGLEIEIEFGKVIASMKEGPNEGSYNSSTSTSPPSPVARLLANSFGKIENQSITLHLDRHLRIQQIDGLRSLIERMSENLQPNLKAMIYSIFDEDRIKQLVYLTSLPEGTIAEGYAWPIHETRAFGLLGQTKLDGIAKFARHEKSNNRNRILIELSGDAKAAEPGENPQPFVLQSGTFEGKAWFDPERGHYADSILTYRLNVRPRNSSPPQTGNPGHIEVIQKYSVKLDRIEVVSEN